MLLNYGDLIDLSFRMVLGFAQTEGKLNLPQVVALQIDESKLALVTDFVSDVESVLRGREKGAIVRTVLDLSRIDILEYLLSGNLHTCVDIRNGRGGGGDGGQNRT